MKKLLPLIPAAAVFISLSAGYSLAQEAFTFYDLAFGMAREDVEELYPSLVQNQVISPGHGMASLELLFDREELLMEIRAAYQKPQGKLEEAALKRALREKFIAPIRARHPEIAVNTDDFLNNGAITVIFLSTGIRDKNIEYYKMEFLKAME